VQSSVARRDLEVSERHVRELRFKLLQTQKCATCNRFGSLGLLLLLSLPWPVLTESTLNSQARFWCPCVCCGNARELATLREASGATEASLGERVKALEQVCVCGEPAAMTNASMCP
jgi:hypothetical protein